MRLCRSAHKCAQHEPCRGTENTVSVVNMVSPLAVLRVTANWPLTTAVNEANETVNRGVATPWFNLPACSPFLVYFVV